MKITKLLLLGFVLCACSCIPYAQRIGPEYLNPPQLRDGLPTSSARAAGFNLELLTQLSNKIDSGQYVNVHSVLVLHKGKLVYEKYSGGFGRDSIHSMRSISKFITSTLVGIAVDRGDIPSIEERIFDFLPEYESLKTPEKYEIRLKHLLNMTAGIEWRESDVPYGTDENDETQMYRDGEWVRYTLSKPLIHQPGTKWEYSGGLANLMAAILQNATGMPGDEYARRYLCKPLGIQQFKWNKNKDHGWVSAAAGVSITPRALAKIGQMFLDSGYWKGNKVLSKGWTEASGKNQIPPEESGQIGPFAIGYGYTTLVILKGPDFMPGLKGFAATGNGGQILWILPEDDLVMVMTGGNYDSELSQTQPIDMAVRYVYPALPGK